MSCTRGEIKVRVNLAVQSDLYRIADNMRAADRREVKASSGFSPRKALLVSFYRSDKCYTVLLNEKPIAMFGVTQSDHPDAAVVWLLATPDLEKVWVRFLRESRRWMDELQAGYKAIYNFIDCRNTKSIRWLEAHGWKQIRRSKEFSHKQDTEFVLMARYKI
jgi:hypothetical protein